MFTCSRVRDDIVISVNYKALLKAGALGVLLLILAPLLYIVVILKLEILGMKHEVYSAISQTMGDVISTSFAKNHATLLKVEGCQSELISCQAMLKDVAAKPTL